MRLRPGVAIDLGTVNTLVYVSGRGIVLEEPSAIAIDRETGGVVAVGDTADALTGKEPQDIDVIHPLRDGVIADLDASVAMLQGFLRKVHLRRGLLRGSAVVCVPSGATWVERRSLIAAVEAQRPRCRVKLVDEPVAAAAGAGIGLTDGTGAFMDEAIVHAVKAELGLLIGRNAARNLKMTLGLGEGAAEWMEVVGVDAARRTPRVEYVPGRLVAEALDHTVAAIADSAQEMLSDIPPNLAEDVVRGKIRLAGGGALLPGLASKIEAVADIPAFVVDDPLRCVIRGAAEVLEHGYEAK